MQELKHRGLATVIREFAASGKPLLGICLGMQLMCDHSDEGNVDGLGIFPLSVARFKSSETKVPHIGWNTVHYNRNNKLFINIKQEKFI